MEVYSGQEALRGAGLKRHSVKPTALLTQQAAARMRPPNVWMGVRVRVRGRGRACRGVCLDDVCGQVTITRKLATTVQKNLKPNKRFAQYLGNYLVEVLWGGGCGCGEGVGGAGWEAGGGWRSGRRQATGPAR